MSHEPIIWVLEDDRAGNVSQCLGVAERLGLPFIEKSISYNGRAKLPNFLLGASLRGLDRTSRNEITSPWPDLVIAAGRRTAPVARYIKKKNAGKTKLVQIMHPGESGADDFDLICVPAHDEKSFAQNEMTIIGAPHRITEDKLAESARKWATAFAEFPHPRIGLIVGGATRKKSFSPAMAEQLGRQIDGLATAMGGSVLVTTSRRTGDAAKALMQAIKGKAFKFEWGDEGENPYFGILALADILVVTADSVSMCSESCATGKPVYIYAPENLIGPKHRRMVNSLFAGGYARPFEGALDGQLQQKLDVTGEITARVREMLYA